MELTDFITKNFLSSFTGTLIAVELIVFVTKDIYLIKKIPTRLYTFILAIIHLLIVKSASSQLTWNIECIYRLFINSLVITVFLCGGYDTISEKIKINKIKENSKSKNLVENEDMKI